MVSLSWSDLCYSVGDKEILKNVSGHVNAGETLAVLGPSGSGKTSLMNVLGGKIRHGVKNVRLSGSITLNGHIPRFSAKTYAFSPAMDFISLVEQDDIFLLDVTVFEHLSFHAKIRLFHLKKPDRNKRVRAVLRRLRLLECENTLLTALSGGQKKRVSIGEELLNNPEILFLDEPTSGLDSTMAQDVVEILYLRNLDKPRGDARTATGFHDNSHTSMSNTANSANFDSEEEKKALILRHKTWNEDWGQRNEEDEEEENDDDDEQKEENDEQKEEQENDEVERCITTTIVFSIHQPSSHVYSLFSDALFLAQGHAIFLGQADDVVANLESRLHIRCPAHYNGAEFALDMINSTERVKKLVSSSNGNSKADIKKSNDVGSDEADINVGNGEADINVGNGEADSHVGNGEADIKRGSPLEAIDEVLSRRKKASWCTEFSAIWWRTLVDRFRNKANTRLSYLNLVVVMLLVGTIYWQLESKPTAMIARNGALMVISPMPLFQETFNNASHLVFSAKTVQREYQSKRLYSLSSFFWARTTGELPVQILFPVSYALFSFFMIGFFAASDWYKLLTLTGILYAGQASAQGLGYFVGSLTSSFDYVITLVVCIMVPMWSLSPQYLGDSAVSIPIFLQWVPHISIFRWLSQALCVWCWQDVQLIDWAPSLEDQAKYIRNCCNCVLDSKVPDYACQVRQKTSETQDSKFTTEGFERLSKLKVPRSGSTKSKTLLSSQEAAQKNAQTTVKSGHLDSRLVERLELQQLSQADINGGRPYVLIDGNRDMLPPMGVDVEASPDLLRTSLLWLVGLAAVFRLLAFLRFYVRYKCSDSCRAICCIKDRLKT